MTKKIFFLILSFISFFYNGAMAQHTGLEQTFHESGKINVVIAIIIVIFIGLVFYLIKLDKKISRIEKEIKK